MSLDRADVMRSVVAESLAAWSWDDKSGIGNAGEGLSQSFAETRGLKMNRSAVSSASLGNIMLIARSVLMRCELLEVLRCQPIAPNLPGSNVIKSWTSIK